MDKIGPSFKKLGSQVIYFMMVPVFFVVFVLVYRPFDIDQFLDMGRGLYPFNITIMSCIVLVTMVITRLTFYFLRNILNLSTGWYMFWCGMEIVVISHFEALYLWLMLQHTMPYFEVLGKVVEYMFFILIYAYVLIALSLSLTDARNRKLEPEENLRMRFYDDKGNLKLLVASNNVFYIESKENYIIIYYIENTKMKSYQLRATMKSIEELCQVNGLIRCHRSFFINQKHVKLLRRDKDGIILAELDSPQSPQIPVSKRYYETISNML